MADLTRTIEIIFGAVDQTGAGLQSVADNISGLSGAAESVTQPLADVADAAVKAEAAIISLATIYGTYAVVKAAEFQSAQIDLKKTLSGTDPAVEGFTERVRELSETYGESSAGILQGIANFKQAGFTAEESANLQKTALDLVIAGSLSAADASALLVRQLKGFAADASEAPRFLEALNNVSATYNTSVGELSEGMARLSPIAKIMGFSFEEATGLLTPAIEVFGSGSEAADALKTGLLKLVSSSKEVQTALSALGVAQLDSNGQMREGKDIFEDVATSFQHLNQNQKLVYAQQLFGIDQTPKLIQVFGDLERVHKITAIALEKTGSATKEVDLRLDSSAKKADIAKVSFENLAIIVGEKLNKQFDGISDGASSVTQALSDIVTNGGLEPFLLALQPLTEGFSATLENIAKNLPAAFEQLDFSDLLDALKELGFQFGQIFDGLDLNTVDGLRDAIQFVIDTFTALTNTVAGITNAWGPTIKAFVAAQGAINATNGGVQEFLGTILVIAQQLNDFSRGVLTGADALDGIGRAMQLIAGVQVVQKLKDFVDWLRLAGTGAAGAGTGMTALGAALPIIGLGLLTTGATDAAMALASGEKSSLGGAIDWVVEKTTGKNTLEDFVYSLNLFGEGARESAVNALELQVNVERLKNASGDATVTVDNYRAKLAEFADETARAAEEQKRFGGKIDDSKTNFTDLNSVLELSRQIQNDWSSRVLNGVNSVLEFSGAVDGTAGKMITLNGGLGLTADEFDKFTAEADKLNAAMGKTPPAAEKAERGFKSLEEAEYNLLYVTDDAYAKYISFENGLYKIIDTGFRGAESTNKLADATDKAAKAAEKGSEEWKRVQDVLLDAEKRTDDFAVAMGELANKRYEIDVKASVDLQTAQIEADTQRISAAFEATAAVIATLTTGVTDLWSTFAQGNLGPGKSIKLEEAAHRMEERLDEELQLKREMTRAVVEQANATTERLASGEPLISIDAGTLAPELELVFDKILKFTQIKATQQGLSLLVGL